MKNISKNRISKLIIAYLILSLIGDSVSASSKFDEAFFNLNNIVYYDATEDRCESYSSTTLTGADNIEKVWNFFKSKGLPDTGIAALIGGKWGETGGSLDPKLIQSGQPYDEARAMSNESMYGFGIAQWDGVRRPRLLNYAKEKGQGWDTLELQLDFMWHELTTGYTDVLEVLKTGTLEEGVRMWVGGNGFGYERPAAQYVEGRNAEGIEIGKQLLATYGGKSSPSGSALIGVFGNITFIGDSLTEGVKDKLTSTFTGSNVDAVVGRGISGSSSVINFLNSSPSLMDKVVINIGANDNFPINNAKEMLDKLKDKKVYLVNNYSKNQNADFEKINANINTIAKDYDNVTVLDWKSEVEKNGGKGKFYDADGVHMNEEGKKLYIDFLNKSLNETSSSNSNDECGSGNLSSGGSIADRAIELSWAEGDQRAYNKEVTDKQREALEKTGLANYGEQWVQIGASCDAFVSMVMSTTVDPEFVKHCCGVVNLANYMRSNPDKYEKIPYDGTTSNMRPGDIMAAGTGGGPNAHIQFYVEVNGEAKVANGGWSRTTGVIEPMNLSIMESLGPVEIFRWKG